MIEGEVRSRSGGAREFLPQVESLRGFAALAVAYSHCSLPLIFSALTPATALHNFVHLWLLVPLGWVMNGAAAVAIFFVISGLVIGLSLDRTPAHRSAAAFAGFLWRRGFRLYPAHIVALSLFLPFAWLLFHVPVQDPAALAEMTAGKEPWIDGTLFLRPTLGNFARTASLWTPIYNPVTWTLRIEMIACLFLPFFAALSARGKLGRDAGVMLLLVAAGAVLRFAGIQDMLFAYLPAFYLGCMARTQGRSLAAVLSRLPWGPDAALLVSASVLLAPLAILAPDAAPYPVALVMSGGAFVLVSVIAWSDCRGVSRTLMHPLSRRLGQLSYSFYLWHVLILYAVTRTIFVLFRPELLAEWRLAVLFVTLTTTIPAALLVAAISYRWIEKPFISFSRWTGWHRILAPVQRRLRPSG